MKIDSSQIAGFFQDERVKIALTILLVFVVTLIVVHLATRFLKHSVLRDAGVLPSGSIFLNITRAVIWIIAVCVVLDSCFGVNASAIIAALGVGGIALSLGFQDTIANLIGGLQVSLLKLIKPGERIAVGSDLGTVVDITWRHVVLENDEGHTVIIPNAVVNKTAVIKLANPE